MCYIHHSIPHFTFTVYTQQCLTKRSAQQPYRRFPSSFMSFEQSLNSLEAVADATLLFDNHAHPINPVHPPMPLVHVITEAHPPPTSTEIPSIKPPPPPPARSSLPFRRSLRDMYHLLHPNSALPEQHHVDFRIACEIEHQVELKRVSLGVERLAKTCFEKAGIAAVLVDDGLPIGSDWKQTGHIAGVRTARVLRLETLAEEVLAEAREGGEGKRIRLTKAQRFRTKFWSRIDPLPEGVVAFKSICAYRGGFDIRMDWTEEQLEEALECLSGGRLEDRIVVDFVVKWGMEAARLHDIPVQFHSGFGDRDLRLQKANPVLLRDMLEMFDDVKVVFLHAAWPFIRDVAYLTAVYDNVYVDIGLAIPLLSTRGMTNVMESILEIAPLRKILYSSDAHSVPDVFYLAARQGRRVVARAIADSVSRGDLSLMEGKKAVQMILAENSVNLYNIEIEI